MAFLRTNKRLPVILAAILFLSVVFVILLIFIILPSKKMSSAKKLLAAGDRDSACALIRELTDNRFMSSGKYNMAAALQADGEYGAAFLLLDKMTYKDSAERRSEISRLLLRQAEVGDAVFFGSCEQDNRLKNGRETIQWRVLAKEGNALLLISEYGLDCRKYQDECVSTTWESSALRPWLNGAFFNESFTEEEKNRIMITNVTADANPGYSTNVGNDTRDKIFLLSTEETERYFLSDKQRVCPATAYTVAQGAIVSDRFLPGGKTSASWWTRTAGDKETQVSLVFYDGNVEYYGHEVNDTSLAVRPALWISLTG